MQLPKIGERVTASSSAPPRYVFFIRLSLQGRSPALPLPFHRMKCYTSFFRFRVQRYNNYLTYASVLQKKMQKYVVKHKKRGSKSPLSFEKPNTYAITWSNPRKQVRKQKGRSTRRPYYLPRPIRVVPE